MSADSGRAPTPGLVGAARRLVRTLLSIVRTRLEILATEVEEQRLRIAQLLLLLCAVVFCAGMAVLMGVLFVVVLLWDTHRLVTIGLFAGMFLAFGLVAAVVLRRQLRDGQKLFSSTLGEIAKDLERVEEQT